MKRLGLPFLVLIAAASPAAALVDIATWQRPPAVLLSPRYEQLRIGYQVVQEAEMGGEAEMDGKAGRDGADVGILALLPWTESFIGGLVADFSQDTLTLKADAEHGRERDMEIDLQQVSVRLAVAPLITPNDMLMIQSGGGWFPGGDASLGDEFNQLHLAYWLHCFNEEFSAALGVAVNQELYGLAPIPLIGFAWQPNDRFRVDGLLPSFAYATWQFASPVYAFARLRSVSNLYHVKTDGVEYDLKAQDAYVTGGLGVHVLGPVEVELSAGGAVARDWKMDLKNGPTIAAEPDPALIYRIQLGVRL